MGMIDWSCAKRSIIMQNRGQLLRYVLPVQHFCACTQCSAPAQAVTSALVINSCPVNRCLSGKEWNIVAGCGHLGHSMEMELWLIEVLGAWNASSQTRCLEKKKATC